MKYRAGINTSDGPAWGQVLDLPGCSVTAPDANAIETLLPLAASLHLAWLRRHGEAVGSPDAVEIEIVERVNASETDAQDGEFCYADDLRPLTDEDLAEVLRAMSYARADLLATIDRLSGAVLDWRPPRSAVAHIDPWQPEPLTIREILHQLPASESYYRNCLRDGLIPDEPESIGHDLHAQRELTIATFETLPPEDRGRMFLPKTSWGEKPEHWTARKSLRRIIGHERFHAAEIQQRLSWLLLGVPEFSERSATAGP